jgi:hypothetical protein
VAVRDAFAPGAPLVERSAQVEYLVKRLARIDPRRPPDAITLRRLWSEGVVS